MNWFLLVRFLHILSAISFVGGVFARQFVRSVAYRTNNVHHFAILSQGAGQIERLMVIPGSLTVLVLGIILALINHTPMLGFLQGAPQNWLLFANVLLVVDILAVPLVFVPRGKQYVPILEAAITAGAMTSQLRSALDDRLVRMTHWYEMGSLVVILGLMVFKPF